jgi:hypothetical protein
MDTNTNIEKRTSVNELNNDIKNISKDNWDTIDRKYIIKVNGKEETHLEFIIPQTGNLSQNGRKKLASRIVLLIRKQDKNL